jgi:CBS-domain-containing membrane protein
VVRARRLPIRHELLLAVLPTATMLIVLAFVDTLTRQRLLFASLAGSAFLIYIDPEHRANSVGTVIIAHTIGATIGLALYRLSGPVYVAAGTTMICTILAMILLDRVHPPAVGTSLAFSFRAGDEQNWLIFMLALLMVALLVLLQRATVWLLRRINAT